MSYVDVAVDNPNPAAVAPLTPKLTATLGSELLRRFVEVKSSKEQDF